MKADTPMTDAIIIHQDSRGTIEEVRFGKGAIRYCIAWSNGQEIWTNDLKMAHDLLNRKEGSEQLSLFSEDTEHENAP